MKIYVTKLPNLKIGIECLEARRTDTGTMIVGNPATVCCRYFHKEGRDWHATKEQAVTRMNVLRDRKLASLRKEIAQLEAFDFTKLA